MTPPMVMHMVTGNALLVGIGIAAGVLIFAGMAFTWAYDLLTRRGRP